jgi:hypothetical protein
MNEIKKKINFIDKYDIYYCDGDNICKYDDNSMAIVKEKIKNKERIFEITINGNVYIINIDNMTQKNKSSGIVRNILIK